MYAEPEEKALLSLLIPQHAFAGEKTNIKVPGPRIAEARRRAEWPQQEHQTGPDLVKEHEGGPNRLPFRVWSEGEDGSQNSSSSRA